MEKEYFYSFDMKVGKQDILYASLLYVTGLYYGASICLVSFASGLSVVTLNIYYRGVRGGSVPTLIRTVVLNHLARFVFMRFEKAESKRTPQVIHIRNILTM